MLTSPAWLLKGMTGTVPGILSWDDARLRLVTEAGVVLDAAPEDVVRVVWPRLWMGGGCKLTVGDQEHRVSFARPNGAPGISDALLGNAHAVLGAALDVRSAVSSFNDAHQGRQAGKRWRELLDQQLAGGGRTQPSDGRSSG
jgi:hypothetical protein